MMMKISKKKKMSNIKSPTILAKKMKIKYALKEIKIVVNTPVLSSKATKISKILRTT